MMIIFLLRYYCTIIWNAHAAVLYNTSYLSWYCTIKIMLKGKTHIPSSCANNKIRQIHSTLCGHNYCVCEQYGIETACECVLFWKKLMISLERGTPIKYYHYRYGGIYDTHNYSSLIHFPPPIRANTKMYGLNIIPGPCLVNFLR